MTDETTTAIITDETVTPIEPAATAAPAIGRPRIRWGAIIWGLVFAAIGAVVLVITTDPTARDDVYAWWSSLTPAGIALTVLLAIGALLLVAGVAGLARRASRRAGER